MKFPDKYFEGEEREGFYIEPMMKRAWASQMEILSEIDSVCRKHNIKYFVFWGTLLGAVRHKGFIPWDDDLDIAMLRDDYNRFLELPAEELLGLKVISLYHEPEWEVGVGRVTNGNGIILMPDELKKYHGCPFAMGIDIFPFDYVPDDGEALKEQKNIIAFIENTIYLIKNNNTSTLTEEINSSLDELEEAFEFKFNRNTSLVNQLSALRDQVYSMYGNQNSKYVTCYEVQHRSKREFIMPTYWMSETIELPFEHIYFPAPKYYEACLTKCYGKEFMVPKRGASAHGYPIYKDQLEFMKERKLYELYEKSMRFCAEDYLQDTADIPTDTISKSEQSNNSIDKKRILYCVSCVDVYGNELNIVDKIEKTLNVFSELGESVDITISIDELAINIIEHANKYEAERIRKIIRNHVEAGGKFVGFNDIPCIINNIDAYYGSNSMYTKYFINRNKPVMIQNIKE